MPLCGACWRARFPLLLASQWLVRMAAPLRIWYSASGLGSIPQHPCGSHQDEELVKLAPSLSPISSRVRLPTPGCSRDAHHRQAKGCQIRLVTHFTSQMFSPSLCNQYRWRSDTAQCYDRHLDTQSCCVDSDSGEHKESNDLPNTVTHCRNCSCLQHPKAQPLTKAWG